MPSCGMLILLNGSYCVTPGRSCSFPLVFNRERVWSQHGLHLQLEEVVQGKPVKEWLLHRAQTFLRTKVCPMMLLIGSPLGARCWYLKFCAKCLALHAIHFQNCPWLPSVLVIGLYHTGQSDCSSWKTACSRRSEVALNIVCPLWAEASG